MDPGGLSERRWQAILARRPLADDPFLYAVQSTGVYCRVGCASRRPKRENVACFDTNEAAERAGYRPCRRCQPDRQPGSSAQPGPAALVEAVCRLLEEAETEPSLAQLAAAVGRTPHYLQRLFKARTGLSPKQYARAQRARRLGEGLNHEARVTDAIMGAGYQSAGRAYADHDAMTPRQRQAGGQGVRIHHALASCDLGRVLVAGTARGICAIELGDDDAVLLDDLRTRFPLADIAPADAAFDAWLRAVLDCLDHPGQPVDLPLDLRGTTFQHRVWTALRNIPPGTTLTYGELATRIGRPGAARAVAGAVAANRLAVAVPCHRVVRGDGKLSGFRWGVGRKKELLRREAAEKRD